MTDTEPKSQQDIIKYLVDRKFGVNSYSDGLTIALSADHVAWKRDLKGDKAVESFRKALGEKTPPELNALYQAEQARGAEEKKAAVEAEERGRFFNHPNAQADLSHWGKMDLWTLDEAIALTLGKDPKAVNWENIEPYFKLSPFADEYAGRRDLVMRAVAAGLLTEPTSPHEFLTWAKRKKILYPPKLEKHVAVHVGETGATPESPRPESHSEMPLHPTGVEYSAASASQPADWRNQIKNWYVDEYIPEQGNKARPPSRSDDVDAAHAAFPEWNFGRSVVWGLRQKHAPKEWKYPGAPKKAKK